MADKTSLRIKEAIEKSGLTLMELQSKTGISKSAIQRYASGETDKIPVDAVKLLAKATNVSAIYLMGWDASQQNNDEQIYKSAGIDFIRVPLYSNLCCGNGGFVEDNILEYVPVPSKGLSATAEYFCQIASGESMKDAGINDGDLLVFEKTPYITNGSIGCFCVDDNVATCKKYKEQNGMIMLQPMNSEFDSIPVDPMNNSFRCLGKLRKAIKDFEV